MAEGLGGPDYKLTGEQIESIIIKGTPETLYKGKKVLVLTPDATRTSPLPLMIHLLRKIIGDKAEKLDFMVALGTHQPLKEEEILKLYGITDSERRNLFKDSRVYNHEWYKEGTLIKVGKLTEDDIEKITGGLFREEVDIVINKHIYDYDLILILGPVFPHEVVGYSGGNKYLFPGISGGEFVHFFHWLGAVITCWKTIGFKHTPVREVVNRATSFVTIPRHNISMVVRPDNHLAGLYAGTPEEAWSDAAELSSKIHVVYKDKPYKVVLGRAPEMYDEIWTAGKVMYKLEPVIADGGKLIIYAPHIKEVSFTWGKYLDKIGYHVRDYFLKQMDRFHDIPRGVIAHSTHVRGVGTFEDGIEKPRIEVVLATAIPEKKCREINLGYMDPQSINIEEYKNRENEGILYVDHAGEVLHRLKSDK
ncbi:MAG: DUF2088 domain-containing protein [Spirochaetes bacterium]|nr:DUF2088 domain-containing protein [Spirochaetota bacterium]